MNIRQGLSIPYFQNEYELATKAIEESGLSSEDFLQLIFVRTMDAFPEIFNLFVRRDTTITQQQRDLKVSPKNIDILKSACKHEKITSKLFTSTNAVLSLFFRLTLA